MDDASTMNSTPMNNLELSHVTKEPIYSQQFIILIKVETIKNTEEISALIDCGAEGLFIDKSISHKWRRSILQSPIPVRNVDGVTVADHFYNVLVRMNRVTV